LFADSHNILASWRNHFSQILNIRGINDVRQTDLHTADPLVPEPSAFEGEMAIEKLKRHKSPYIDPVPAKCIKAGSSKIPSEVHKLTNSIGNKEEFPEDWKESIIVPAYKKGDRTVVIKGAYDMIYLLTAIGLSPGGSSTVHIYTQTIYRTIQNKQYIEQHNNFGRVRAVPRLG